MVENSFLKWVRVLISRMWGYILPPPFSTLAQYTEGKTKTRFWTQ
jgi:hypothetical protein